MHMCVSDALSIRMFKSFAFRNFRMILSASSRRTSTKSGRRRSVERCRTKPKECAVEGQLLNFHEIIQQKNTTDVVLNNFLSDF